MNELREKDGKPRVWEEKMSFKHVYDSRATPNYPFGLKKQGAFVWDRTMHEPPVLPNLQEQSSQQPARQPPKPSSETVTLTTAWPVANNIPRAGQHSKLHQQPASCHHFATVESAAPAQSNGAACIAATE